MWSGETAMERDWRDAESGVTLQNLPAGKGLEHFFVTLTQTHTHLYSILSLIYLYHSSLASSWSIFDWSATFCQVILTSFDVHGWRGPRPPSSCALMFGTPQREGNKRMNTHIRVKQVRYLARPWRVQTFHTLLSLYALSLAPCLWPWRFNQWCLTVCCHFFLSFFFSRWRLTGKEVSLKTAPNKSQWQLFAK